MKRPTTATLFAAMLLQFTTTANAQLVEAECGTSWPGFPFPESIYLERAQSNGLEVAWREFAASDAIRGGPPPPAQPAASSSPSWIWYSDLYAIARTSDLGIFVSRFNKTPYSRVRGVTDGYIVSAWAFTKKGTSKLIANTWLHEQSDRLPSRPQCGIRLLRLPGGLSSAPRAPDASEVGAAVSPPAALRDADNALIAKATCRDRWPPIIAASGEGHGLFLLPGVGEVTGGANLRPLFNLLPDGPVRWRRLKFLASRDGTLGLSIGRLVSCDEPSSTQTYLSAWVRDGASWRLELLAIVP